MHTVCHIRKCTSTQSRMQILKEVHKSIIHPPDKHAFLIRICLGAAPSHPWPCQSSSNGATPSSWEQWGGMKDVYSARVYLYLTLSVSTYLFSFFTPLYQPNLNDLNSIWAPKHLSLPYLWIMERFSGIQNFIESTPLRFTLSPLLLHSSSYISSSLNAYTKYILLHGESHVPEYIQTYMHQHAYHPPLNPFLPPSLTQESWLSRDRRTGWLVLHQPSTNHSTPLAPVLPLLPSLSSSPPPSFSPPHPLPPPHSLPLVCLCHQLGLAGSQAALGSARLAFPLWHGTTGPSCCVHACVHTCAWKGIMSVFIHLYIHIPLKRCDFSL